MKDNREKRRETNKIAIIGAGMVGSTIAYTLLTERAAGEVVLVDIDRRRAQGEAMDLSHSQPFGAPIRIRAGSYDDCAESDVVVITAGAAQKEGETRLSLAGRNVKTIREIGRSLGEVMKEAIVIVVANPVDVLTHALIRSTGTEAGRVFGAGTVLDTARLRAELGAHCKVDPRNVHGYVLGEHGDSEVPVWSLANIAGVQLKEFCVTCGKRCPDVHFDEIARKVRTAAYEIIARKGATYYAIGLGTTRLIQAVLRNTHSVHTVSVMLTGQYGIRDVCLSLPCVLGRQGVERALELPLTKEEEERLRVSAGVLRGTIDATREG